MAHSFRQQKVGTRPRPQERDSDPGGVQLWNVQTTLGTPLSWQARLSGPGGPLLSSGTWRAPPSPIPTQSQCGLSWAHLLRAGHSCPPVGWLEPLRPLPLRPSLQPPSLIIPFPPHALFPPEAPTGPGLWIKPPRTSRTHFWVLSSTVSSDHRLTSLGPAAPTTGTPLLDLCLASCLVPARPLSGSQKPARQPSPRCVLVPVCFPPDRGFR